MEFYTEDEAQTINDKRFNSQRDGILLVATLVKRFIVWVSIPNGMEFYATGRDGALLYSLVSIPNGMEFYYDTLPASEMNLLFQFLMG